MVKMNCYKSCFFIFMFSNLFVGNQYIQCKFLQDIFIKDSPQKYIIHGTFVIEQDSKINIEKEHQPKHKKPIVDITLKKPVHRKNHPEITPTQIPNIKNISNSFKFTEYHKQNLNNIYINLAYQTECMGFTHYQCWSSKLEFENEIIDNFHVRIDGIVTPECKPILNRECTLNNGINCFRMICPNKWLYVYTNNSDSKDWLLPRKSTFFLLEKGNYHSSWQAATFLGPITLANIKFTQDVIKKINYYEHFSNSELLLTFSKIHENYNMTFIASWLPVQSIEVPKIKRYISLHSKIQTGPELKVIFLLHERVHEYINRVTLEPKLIKYEDQWVYTGNKTVDLVLKDSQSDTKLSKSLIFMRENGNTKSVDTIEGGKYGLIMQDRSHLGDWGPEAGASNYQHSISNIGKYTMSVINEFGYHIT